MINNVVLVGRLTRDVDLKYTQSGKAFANFTIAVNRNFKNQNGEREADFINCVIWNKQAEMLADWAIKGTLIGVTGSMQTRHYDKEDGQRVYITEVIANNFQILEARQARENNANNFNQNTQEQVPNFARDESPVGNSSPMEISDDDLPF